MDCPYPKLPLRVLPTAICSLPIATCHLLTAHCSLPSGPAIWSLCKRSYYLHRVAAATRDHVGRVLAQQWAIRSLALDHSTPRRIRDPVHILPRSCTEPLPRHWLRRNRAQSRRGHRASFCFLPIVLQRSIYHKWVLPGANQQQRRKSRLPGHARVWLGLGIFLVMQPAQDSLARFRVIGLNKLFPDAEGGKFRPLVTLHKKAALVGKDRRFDQDDFRNLASSKTKCHYRSTSESSPIISR